MKAGNNREWEIQRAPIREKLRPAVFFNDNLITVLLHLRYLNISWSPLAEFLASWPLPIGFATWVQADAREARRTPCYDFGTFIFATWLISVPIYLISTRGWKGLLLTAMFICMLMAPGVSATLLWTFLYQV